MAIRSPSPTSINCKHVDLNRNVASSFYELTTSLTDVNFFIWNMKEIKERKKKRKGKNTIKKKINKIKTFFLHIRQSLRSSNAFCCCYWCCLPCDSTETFKCTLKI